MWHTHVTLFFQADVPVKVVSESLEVIFIRNLAFIGASIALFATFVALGDDMRYVITAPLFDL